MRTLGDVIALRGSKYTDEMKNPSYTEFWEGYFEGWEDAYRDLKEILEQNKFNMDVTVTNVGHKTNADHIRAMTDEELKLYLCYISDCAVCLWQSSSGCKLKDWLKQPYKEDGDCNG